MAESHVISALIKKRSELSGEIEHYEKIIKECRENLTSIDKTIHIFDETYLYIRSRKKKQNIKTFIMDSKVVVGVGNIYACESLFMAGINPQCKAGSVSKKSYQLLTLCIKDILTKAIKAGGTTLQNFSQVDGTPGYFAQTLSVYGRENESCSTCNGKIVRITQNQRSTFYCSTCQT